MWTTSAPLAPVKRCCAALSSLPQPQLIFPTPAHAHTYASVRCQTAAGRRAECAVDVAQDEPIHRPRRTCAAGLYGAPPFVTRVCVVSEHALAVARPWWQRSGRRSSSRPSRALHLFPSSLPAPPPPPPLVTVPDREGHARRLAVSVSSFAATPLVLGHMLPLPSRAYS